MKTNPMLSIKKPGTPKKDEKKYVPTPKLVEQVAESVALPTAPEELEVPSAPPLTVIPEETAPSS
jgi:hypothetical protein